MSNIGRYYVSPPFRGLKKILPPNISIQWIRYKKTDLPNDTNQTLVASSNGSYAVEITKNNCVDTSQCVVILSVGLENFQKTNWVKVYPNPTLQNLIIETASGQGNNASYIILDVMGKEIKSGQLFGNKTILPLNVADGIYYLRIRNNQNSRIIKVIKN